MTEFSAKRAAKGTGFKNCCLLRLFCLKQSSKSSFPYNISVVKWNLQTGSFDYFAQESSLYRMIKENSANCSILVRAGV